MMIELLVQVIAQQDAHDASDDSKDTKIGRELASPAVGGGQDPPDSGGQRGVEYPPVLQ